MNIKYTLLTIFNILLFKKLNKINFNMIRYLNYFIIAFITSGLSASYLTMINNHKISNMEDELKKQYQENKELKEKIKPPKQMDEVLNTIYDSIIFILKEVNNVNAEKMDEELVDGIKLTCNQILESLTPKSPLKLEVESDDSFENLNTLDRLD